MNDFSELRPTNKETAIAIIVCAVLLVVIFCFMLRTGNEEIYHDTNRTVERIEERSNAIGQGLDRVQERVEQSKKTVTGIAEAVADSRKNAETVAGAVERAEQRLDNATQRIGRIKNLISDIEAKY